MRTCPGCGLEERRSLDINGRPIVNLDPVSGRCVKCLVKSAAAHPWPAAAEPFDARAAAARNDD